MEIFISYATPDQRLAEFVHRELAVHQVGAFLAPVSIPAGAPWAETILVNLRSTNRVLVLASRAACASGFVNQEVGGALLGGKLVIPVVWDMSPAELPGWLAQRQALDLREATAEDLRLRIGQLAHQINAEKATAALVVGALMFGVIVVAVNSKSGRRAAQSAPVE